MIVFRAQAPIWIDGVQMIAARLDGEGRMSHVANPVQWEMTQRTPHDEIREPTFYLTADEARSMMTALWECGVRPAGISSPSSEIKRIEDHLADMRRLVFKEASTSTGTPNK